MRSFVMKTAFFMDKTLALPFPDEHPDGETFDAKRKIFQRSV